MTDSRWKFVKNDDPTVKIEWTWPFRVHLSDGTVLDGAQFPSGRCIVDRSDRGFVDAATSLEELGIVKSEPSVKIEWGPTEMRAELLTEKQMWRASGMPCNDPQCNDSTWDHPCPVPPPGVDDD